MSKQCDLLITNASIINGDGSPAFMGSIAVSGDEIVAIGDGAVGYSATRTIDAAGRYVTPGFVDIHTHIDIDMGGLMFGVLSDRYLENMVRQGITTAIGGNCGYSGLEIGKFIDTLNEGKCGCNVGVLAGHGMMRIAAMGMENRAPTPAELERMKGMTRKAMDEGAFGLSTGLGYAPGNYSDVEELVPLCEIVKEYDGLYTSHIRNQDRKVRESWQEIIELGRKSGARVHISHFQVIGEECWGAAPELIDMLNAAREEGICITGDTFPYEGAGWSIVGVLIPNWVQAGGGPQGTENLAMKARLRDPELLPKIRAEILDTLSLRGNAEGILILNGGELQELNNRFLSEIAAAWGMEPVDAVIKIALETSGVECTGFQCCFEDKRKFFESPYCSVASDANSALVNVITHTPTQPRMFGCFPRFIQTYVKETPVFTLEEAVRKMTSLPADTMGIKGRGLLAVGNKADIVIMDYDKVADNAQYTDTLHFPSGIDTVVINGKVAVLDGVHQKIMSGIGLRYSGR
ncbi:MAG: amidohydrolase family protein [Pseudoflavonifractor sp.]